ncbi:MAG: 2-succinyl-5-enolpyruvyl-6-hydroxy-3-cyclohexene-1-carboxylic-acid synthase [Prevotella sp.]|nr:2-succinyl-5-enolpyruvyl-6-hydroxy-3-cyclohexene-1-carboxylic-acid synthase [Prevotella sp.]MCM1074282.1 2-succinyl-5-enolpyruvyl-6-hydroxy-3-cyclohexene-1-carboxylic-acid synthase [Ruminococcus sp.]
MKSKTSCQIVAAVLEEQGVREAVISPGSRNTPFILALDDQPNIHKYTAIDERCAAFVALGISQLSRKPTVLCCTSGTALLNYAPAVAEAYYQGVPLIIISADRPTEWIDQDDSQTLRQFEALRNYVKASFDLPDFPPENQSMCWYANRVANEACLSAMRGYPGPVHINIHFNTPLCEASPAILPQRIVTTTDTTSTLSPQVIKQLADEASCKKVLVVAGQYRPSNRINRAVAALSHLSNVAVWAESTANIHTPGIINCIDRTLTAIDPEKPQFNPDIIISFGGALISRKAKEFLRKAQGCQHWSVGYKRDRMADPFMKLTRLIETSAEVFLPHFANCLCRLKPSVEYADTWLNAGIRATDRHNLKIEEAQWSALKAFAYILSHLPNKANLQLSNGTAIRYAQLFDSSRIHATYCNRGVSGIDGSTSTAIGASLNYGHTTFLISGDMSFAYDIGALALPNISPDMKIVVINNAGGEIFRFISSTSKLPCRETFFSINPSLPLKGLAEAYGFEYFRADNERTLKNVWNIFKQPTLSPSILEIIVDADISARTLSNYFN